MDKIYIGPELINLNLKSETKSEAIEEMAKLISENIEFTQSIKFREKIMSTYCGEFIAIPHGISETISKPILAFGRSHGIEWDGEIVKYIFMFGIPEEYKDKQFQELKIVYDLISDGNKHLEVLKKMRTKSDLMNLIKGKNKKL